jgi:hypothetical protein
MTMSERIDCTSVAICMRYRKKSMKAGVEDFNSAYKASTPLDLTLDIERPVGETDFQNY